MEIHLAPEALERLERMALESGRTFDQLIEDALAGYEVERAETKKTLDSCYDDIESGRVKLIPSDEVYARLREKSLARRATQGS